MITTVIIAIVCFAVGGGLSYMLFRYGLKSKYDIIIKEAQTEAEVIKKNKLLEVKEKFLNKKADLEKEVALRNQKIQQAENKLKQRELMLNQKQEEVQRKRTEAEAIKENLEAQIVIIDKKKDELDKLQMQEREKLEALSGLSAEEAKERLIESLKEEAKTQAASYINDIMDDAKLTANKEAKRIVVKVGTSTITYANGKRNFEQIDRLARELADLQNQGKEMILVTSGAVAVGVDRLGLSEKPKTIPGKQAAAAVGQGILMHTYEKLFAEYGQIVAQVLLTKTESLDRHRYTNSRNTFMELLKNRVIPIVNENDVVALDELKIGDNDNMSALVAGIVDADLVVILSDVDGLYTANPQTHPDAKLVSIVSDITPEIEASAGGVGSSLGTGGMFTKIQAAKAATSSGIHLAIARGDEKYAIARILQGENIGTVFVSKENRLQFRKRWLAFGARIMGKLVIDEGCAKAVRKAGGCSILPAGITAVEGQFEAGNTVSVVDMAGHELARGLSHYSSAELEQIKGAKTSEIEDKIGHKNYDEVIHRDDLVILG